MLSGGFGKGGAVVERRVALPLKGGRDDAKAGRGCGRGQTRRTATTSAIEYGNLNRTHRRLGCDSEAKATLVLAADRCGRSEAAVGDRAAVSVSRFQLRTRSEGRSCSQATQDQHDPTHMRVNRSQVEQGAVQSISPQQLLGSLRSTQALTSVPAGQQIVPARQQRSPCWPVPGQ